MDFVRQTGIFEGETSPGAFRMPCEIVAPVDPALGNGTVLVEPPHMGGRRAVSRLGRDLILADGTGLATVGFGEYGMNILDPDPWSVGKKNAFGTPSKRPPPSE